jgi:hypothetical protein
MTRGLRGAALAQQLLCLEGNYWYELCTNVIAVRWTETSISSSAWAGCAHTFVSSVLRKWLLLPC